MDDIRLKLLQFLPDPVPREPGYGHFIGLVDGERYSRDPQALKAINPVGPNSVYEQKFKLVLRDSMDQLEHSSGSPIKVFNENFCKKGNFNFPLQG